jgi:DNA repair photolyase
MLRVNEITCQSIINRSGIPGLDYTINPYLGCQHGCVYCYARFMTRFSNHQGEWGSFVDIKVNASEVLKKQIPKMQPGLVCLSTVTDPYQPFEKKYQLTRQILTTLTAYHFPISILTKSDLVLRDMDILNQLNRNACEVGFSIAFWDEKIQSAFEPNSPAVGKRIKALKELHSQNIKTWIFIAPILPILTQQTLSELLNEINGFVDYILVDKLNIKCGNWRGISKRLNTHFPELTTEWKNILFHKEKRLAYNETIYRQISDYCQKYNIQVQSCE